jgi:DNA-binding XRE family transcriptional regulator
MPHKTITSEELAALEAQVEQDRKLFVNKPSMRQFLTPEEMANATPLYWSLQSLIAQLKQARQAAGLSLADVAERTGLRPETLSRLETGRLVNPTYQTLAKYAVALGLSINMEATPAKPPR